MGENSRHFLLFVTVPITLMAVYCAYLFLFVAAMNRANRWLRSERIIARDSVKFPPGVETAEEQLLALGFNFVSLLEQHYRRQRQPDYQWFYIDSGEVVTALVHPVNISPNIKYTIEFYTLFPDRSMVITRYPVGENITTEGLISKFSRESIQNAFDFHMQQVTAKELAGNPPFRLKTFADIKHLEQIYDEDHKRRDMRRPHVNLTLQGILFGVIAAAGAVTSGGVLINDSAVINAAFVVGIISMVLLSCLSALGLNQYYTFERQQRKARKA